MKDTRYAFCVAKIRALEKHMLTSDDVASLINQKDYDSAIKHLTNKGYIREDQSFDEALKAKSYELNSVLKESVPDKSELDALYILNDYFNLKVLVKCAIEGNSAENYLQSPSTLNSQNFTEKASKGDFSFLKDEYRLAAENAYKIALKSNNGKFADVIIDKSAIDTLSAFSERKNSGLLGRICAFTADTANIKTALRCALTSQDEEYICTAIGKCNKLDRTKLTQATVSGYEELVSYFQNTEYKNGVEIYTENPSAFEKWCDNKIIELTSSAIYTSFGFDPVVSYFYRKNLEIKTVRMIVTAIKSDVDKKIIRERVRDLYA